MADTPEFEETRIKEGGPASRLARLTSRTWICAAVILGLLLSPMWIGDFGMLVMATGALTVVAALGLHILTHWAGQISLGHVAFVALGAFLTANFSTRGGLPFWTAIVLSALVTVLATVFVGLPALRLRGFHIAITTLAFGYAADRWLFGQQWLTGGSTGILLPTASLPGITFGTTRALYYPIIVGSIAMVLLARKIGRTKAGRAFLAIRADEDVAASWGINVPFYKLLAFGVAGVFGAIAGGLQAYSLGIVGPQTFPVSRSIDYVAMVVIGGPGAIWGTTVAAAAFGMLPAFSWFGRFSTLVGGLGILAVLLQFPGGLNEQGRKFLTVVRARLEARPRKRPEDKRHPKCSA